MTLENKLKSFLVSDKERMLILEQVKELGLNDCWVGAGFVRNLVWDQLHEFETPTVLNDLDVVFFDVDIEEGVNRSLEHALANNYPNFKWSVKNQAHMHLLHGHFRYKNTEDAISHWVETATAVAVRLNDSFKIEVLCPHGLQDLFDLKIKAVSLEKVCVMKQRITTKKWLEVWNQLNVEL